LPMALPEKFERLLVMNTALGTGDAPLPEGFIAWRAYVANNPALDCAKLMQRSCPHLTSQEAAAYEAPFPDAKAKAGVRRFPQLVPDRPDGRHPVVFLPVEAVVKIRDSHVFTDLTVAELDDLQLSDITDILQEADFNMISVCEAAELAPEYELIDMEAHEGWLLRRSNPPSSKPRAL